MGMLIVNNVFFLHAHKLSNGIIVVHAHPYDKTSDSQPYQSHHHTKAELLFFQNLEILFIIVILTFLLVAPFKKEKVLFKSITEYTSICINFNKGRDPPIS